MSATTAPGAAIGPAMARCLEILAALGGEVSTAEIRALLGTAASPATISGAMNRLARLDPPGVVPVGAAHPGSGRCRRWRLAGAEAPAQDGDRVLSWAESRIAGRNARALRIAAGLRQTSFARGLGMAQASLSGYERGCSRMTAGQARAIAEALGVTFGELAGVPGG